VHDARSQARLVMRQRGSQRLLLNANLYPTMAATKMVGGKGVTFAAVNAAPALAAEGGGDAEQRPQGGDAGGDGGGGGDAAAAAAASSKAHMRTYAFKTKAPERIDAFVAAVDAHKGGVAPPPAPAKTGDEWA
jgi:hypothetical protein